VINRDKTKGIERTIDTSRVESELKIFKSNLSPSNVQRCEEIVVWINKQVALNENSRKNYLQKVKHEKKHHPIVPKRGEIYMTEMGTNVGVEFKDYHPVLILQNDKGNLFSETTIVLPMTGIEDGEKMDNSIHYKVTNYDLESKVRNGLDKSPSKIKLADITTIDKARLHTKVGKLKPIIMQTIERKVKTILNFT
jgi:mRNA interferase MazF